MARKPFARGVAQAQGHVEPSRQRDKGEAPGDRQVDAEHPIGADHGEPLTEHGEPAQANDRLQPEPGLALPEPGGHGGAADGLTIVQGSHTQLYHGEAVTISTKRAGSAKSMNEKVSKLAPGGGAPAAGSQAPAEVRDLTKITAPVAAVDRISFAERARLRC
jgi:hypothetical protein